ncbi:MAG: VWA domain-containing protein [Candidatus Rokuibacteriota bacterium]|nr:MAG: VWA domain-containing protein [Candidatus Rokubacteria bacterium]
MEERILEFIGDLRRAELRISTSEALDALAASAEVGLTDRETFKSTLAATLVKEARDHETFDRIFNLYFLDLQALGEGLKKALGPEDPKVQEQLDRLVDEEGLDLDELTELLMRGQGSEMEMAIRGGAQGAGLERLMYFLQVGYFSRRIADQFDWSAIEADIEKIMQALEARGLDPGQLARIRNYLELRLEAFRRMIRQHVQRELERRAYRAGEQLTREVLADKPLFALTPDEVAQMKGVVAKLARRIKDALALRQRQEQKGRIDSRRTIRKSLQYGGVPMEIYLKRRHREKPKLITICDVSDSVRNASRFMLQLVWSLQECFSRVRSYVFVSEIAEVTQAFGTYPVERAIEWALKGAPVDYHCRSDFGYAFSRFANTELESLDRKTSILVLGDARNNYNDPQAWALRLIRERVKGIIWLNPEGQWGWGIGDSVMPLYAPACDIVRECRTVGQLGEVVDNLVHQWWRRGR